MNRLNPQSEKSELKARIESEVNRFASLGLRTLVFAMRELSQEEFNAINWSEVDSPTIAEACEINLNVLACTGLEDKL